MKSNNSKLILTGIAAGIIGLMLASIFFGASPKNDSAPTVGVIESSFPDLKNDPQYKRIFNDNALDPTYPAQVNSSNEVPFTQ